MIVTIHSKRFFQYPSISFPTLHTSLAYEEDRFTPPLSPGGPFLASVVVFDSIPFLSPDFEQTTPTLIPKEPSSPRLVSRSWAHELIDSLKRIKIDRLKKIKSPRFFFLYISYFPTQSSNRGGGAAPARRRARGEILVLGWCVYCV